VSSLATRVSRVARCRTRQRTAPQQSLGWVTQALVISCWRWVVWGSVPTSAAIPSIAPQSWEICHGHAQGPSGGFTGHPSEFRRLIQPKLAGRRPSDLARATGLSPGYCAQVRDGQRVPHLRHWAAFQLVGLAV
jgi:hypothetical protein